MSGHTTDPAQSTSPWFDCKNIGRVEIPAFGIVELDRPEGSLRRDERRILLRVKQPTMIGFTGRMFINGPIPIGAGETGVCTDGRLAVVAYDDKDGTPAAGEIWGPMSDSSKVRKYIPGCRALEAGEDGRVLVMRFEQFDVIGKLTEELEGGGTAEAKLMRIDKDDPSTPIQVVEEDDDEIRFTVREGVYGDGDFETLAEDDIVIGRWDEATDGYLLRGWKCA